MSLEARELIQPVILFDRAVIDSSFKDGRIYTGPRIVDLGSRNGGIESLNDYTQNHPDKHEAGKLFLVRSMLAGILTESDLIPGGKDEFNLPADLEIRVDPAALTLPRKERQNKFLGSVWHSHPEPIPYHMSPHDFYQILLGDNIPEAVTSQGLITPNRKFLVFRGPNSPHMTREEAEKYIEDLSEELDILEESASILVMGEDLNRKPSLEELKRIVSKQMNFHEQIYKRIIGENDLIVFEGDVHDSMLIRVN